MIRRHSYMDVRKLKAYVMRSMQNHWQETHVLCRAVRNFRAPWSMSNWSPSPPSPPPASSLSPPPAHRSCGYQFIFARFQPLLVNRTCYNSEWESGDNSGRGGRVISAKRQSANVENDTKRCPKCARHLVLYAFQSHTGTMAPLFYRGTASVTSLFAAVCWKCLTNVSLTVNLMVELPDCIHENVPVGVYFKQNISAVCGMLITLYRIYLE